MFMQHEPVLSNILKTIATSRLREATFPLAAAPSSQTSVKPSEVIVFIVGGATFSEATKVAQFNRDNPSMRVVLGGSCIHSSRSFVNELKTTLSR